MKKTQNVREGTRKGASRRRKELALALCVSLWMAGGSVAGATEMTVTNVATAATGNPAGLAENGHTYGINEATGCVLNITGGTDDMKNFSASVWSTSNVSNNTLNMEGGSVSQIYGGMLYGAGNATNNTVNLKGGGVSIVFGGYAYPVGGVNDANDNTVNLYTSGAKYNPEVYGGYAPGNSGNAKNNTINVLTVMSLGKVHGGKPGTNGTSSGNTLNIAAKSVVIQSIDYVQNLNFYLPSDIEKNDTMLTVTSATNVNGMTIGVAARQGVNLAVGDSVTLLSGTVTGTAATTTLTTDKTATGLLVDKSYKFNITQNANDITATVVDTQEEQNAERTEQAKSLVETKAATTTFINAGADMLASQGFAQAANAVALEAAEQAKSGTPDVQNVGGFTPFAAFGGSGMRAESGSYVDTRGYGLNVGFARELPNSQGKLLFGPVVEYGGGSYDSYLDNGTHGEGGSHYFGVGIMARQVNHDGFYYEGSLRGGRVTSDYKADLDGVGRVNYDSASNYFAAHLGAGKAFDIGSGNTLDGYFKYFYSHQAGDTATIHIAGMNDETGEFDAVDNHRIRLGARLTHTINEKNKLYGGLAYQYEFGGEARAHFNGNGVPSPSVKGSSGMLELGWQVKPEKSPVAIDLGVTGWAGKQRGVTGQLGFKWNF